MVYEMYSYTEGIVLNFQQGSWQGLEYGHSLLSSA